jgi:hypothetical protein
MKVTTNGHPVDALDRLCPFRCCFHPHAWRGTIIPGRGYQYAPQSAWHWRCEHRACHGCPDPLPDPSPENARCLPSSATITISVMGALSR